ncbi:MAG TPA: TlpA disulfide reductase family protein [Chitinophagaceae bacterium]|nr:TlpA disulfide reductase family protein [Chitinophagaceae bacterium]
MKKASILIFVLVISLQGYIHAQSLQKVNTADLKKLMLKDDAVYVINFWATWCEPCREELPAVLKMARRYEGQQVKVILVSLDYPGAYPKRIRAFIVKHHIDVPVLWLNETNPGAIAAAVYPDWKGFIPFTIFLNRKKGYLHIVEKEIPADDWNAEIKKAL